MSSTNSSPTQNFDEDYSPSATTIHFDPPLSLLRGPLPTAPTDDPSAGCYVLAFRDLGSWSSAFESSKSKIVEQCEEGARIGCAVSASRVCAPPWWSLSLKRADLKEKEDCEVREMERCLVAAKEKCVGFANDKCSKPFMGARVAVPRARERVVEKLISWASFYCTVSELGLRDLMKSGRGLSYAKASELLSRDS